MFSVAFCKNAATSSWYSFNDSRATEMREEEVVTRAAYLLFYQRRSAANDSSRSQDWLSQLQLSANSNLPRTTTSHSLENIVDADKGLSRDVKQSLNFRTLVLKFEFEFDLHTFGIRISNY